METSTLKIKTVIYVILYDSETKWQILSIVPFDLSIFFAPVYLSVATSFGDRCYAPPPHSRLFYEIYSENLFLKSTIVEAA